jgi:hypothetical protein
VSFSGSADLVGSTLTWFFVSRAVSRLQDQVAVRIADDEGARAPRFCSQRLMERHAGGLILQEQWLGVVQRDGCRKQILAGATLRIEYGGEWRNVGSGVHDLAAISQRDAAAVRRST